MPREPHHHYMFKFWLCVPKHEGESRFKNWVAVPNHPILERFRCIFSKDNRFVQEIRFMHWIHDLSTYTYIAVMIISKVVYIGNRLSIIKYCCKHSIQWPVSLRISSHNVCFYNQNVKYRQRLISIQIFQPRRTSHDPLCSVLKPSESWSTFSVNYWWIVLLFNFTYIWLICNVFHVKLTTFSSV